MLQTKRKRAAQKSDTHDLDAQVKDDPSLLDLLTVADVRALCEHHKVSADGTKAELCDRLRKVVYHLKK